MKTRFFFLGAFLESPLITFHSTFTISVSGLQANQASRSARGQSHREAREAAEDGGREEAKAEASGKLRRFSAALKT